MKDSARPVAWRHTYIARNAPFAPSACAAESVNSRVSGDSRLSSRKMFAVGNDPDDDGVVGKVVGRREVVALAGGSVVDTRHAPEFATGVLRPKMLEV